MSDEHLCLLFTPWASVPPLGHSILPQIPMSARYKKRRSCYGINLVLTGKAEWSKQGCLGPRQWWDRCGKAAGRAWRRHRGVSHLQLRSHSMQGSRSDSPSRQILSVGLLQDLCGGMLLFCKNSLCWLLLFVGLLEAGAGHLCHNPGMVQRSQPRAMAVEAMGDSGHRVGSERSGPKGLGPRRCSHVTGWEAAEEVEASFSVSPSPSLFPLHLCLPPLPPALCRHLIIYIKLTFAEFTQGSVIVFFHRFCITNHENGILSSLTNF